MAVYFVAQISIHDRAEYSKYEAGFMPVFEKYKGRLLAVDEAPEVLEGAWSCTRTVLIEFPNREDALAWAGSAEYQAIAKHRWAGSTANIAMIKSLG
jgi:uncharacterized protein (DUF1330 family)